MMQILKVLRGVWRGVLGVTCQLFVLSLTLGMSWVMLQEALSGYVPKVERTADEQRFTFSPPLLGPVTDVSLEKNPAHTTRPREVLKPLLDALDSDRSSSVVLRWPFLEQETSVCPGCGVPFVALGNLPGKYVAGGQLPRDASENYALIPPGVDKSSLPLTIKDNETGGKETVLSVPVVGAVSDTEIAGLRAYVPDSQFFIVHLNRRTVESLRYMMPERHWSDGLVVEGEYADALRFASVYNAASAGSQGVLTPNQESGMFPGSVTSPKSNYVLLVTEAGLLLIALVGFVLLMIKMTVVNSRRWAIERLCGRTLKAILARQVRAGLLIAGIPAVLGYALPALIFPELRSFIVVLIPVVLATVALATFLSYRRMKDDSWFIIEKEART